MKIITAIKNKRNNCKDMNKKIGIAIIIFAIAISISLSSVIAMKNPSAVYCEEMGYEYIIEESEAGQTGVCKFSEAESCNGWEFLTGRCGKEHSYCEKEGYELKTISDSEKCSTISFSPECAVCVLEGGKEVEVTDLMGLSFEEGTCGDGKCTLGECFENCPQDCPSGAEDGYCDKEKDGICDPDCKEGEDIDCAEGKAVCGNDICEEGEIYETCSQDCPEERQTNYLLWAVILLGVVVAVFFIVLIYKKSKREY